MSSNLGRHQRLPQSDPDGDSAPQTRFHTIHDSSASASSSSGSSYPDNQNAMPGGGGGNPLFACCTNCCNNIPFFCRVLMIVIFGGFIAFFFSNVSGAVILYAGAVQESFINVYRVLICTYFGSVVGALFGMLHVFQDTSILEHKKGTVYFIHLWFTVLVMVNSLFLLLMLGFSTFWDTALNMPSHGPWPVLLALLPLQIKLDGREEYRMCFCNVPSKYYPWAMLLLLSLLTFNLAGVASLLTGLLFGYALSHFENNLTLSMITIRRWESNWLSFLTRQSRFVSVDTAGQTQPFSLQQMMMQSMAPQQQNMQTDSDGRGRTYGSGTTGGAGGNEYYGMPPDNIEPDTVTEEKDAAPSVFAAGTGHRLGGGGSSASNAPPSRFTSFFSRSQPAAAAASSAPTDTTARIPTKGLNRLVENAYKQKGAGGGDVELSQRDESKFVSSSSSSSSAATNLSTISVTMPSGMDHSPLLAGVEVSDAEAPVPLNDSATGNDQREKNIGRLMALGYSREDARNALIIADDDFDAAHQFLITPLTSSI